MPLSPTDCKKQEKKYSVFFPPNYLRFDKFYQVEVVHPNYLRSDKYCKEQSCLNKIMRHVHVPVPCWWDLSCCRLRCANKSQPKVCPLNSSPLDKLSGWSTAACWEIPTMGKVYDSHSLGQLQSYFKERSWSVLQCNSCMQCSRANPIGNCSRRLESASKGWGEMCHQLGMLQIPSLKPTKSPS